MFNIQATQFLKSILAFAFIIAFSYEVAAQCNPSNPFTTGSQTNISTLAQSFAIGATCGALDITDITVWSIGGHTGVTLKIYSGAGCSGALLHTQNNITIGGGGNGSPTTFAVTPNVRVVGGSTYTFQLDFQGGSTLLKSTVNTYSDGNYFTNSNCNSTNEDLFFSIFTVAGVFPVELVDFNATNQGDQVQLRWSTASELNNAGFEVEHSTDTRQWETLAFVDGKGTTTEMTDYQYLDRNPAAGLNYYRLRQIDFDGEENYSPVKVVETLAGGTGLAISPNPVMAGTELRLSGIAENVEAIWLTDLYGRPVWMGKSFEGGKTNIALPNDLSGGLYTLLVMANGQKTALKVVVH